MRAIDLYTKSLVNKHELLERATTRIQCTQAADSPWRSRAAFVPNFRKALSFAYRPLGHSFEILLRILDALAGRVRAGHGK